MDVLIKYAFFAARALEIYTFADMSNEIRYDYGYIHPDREEELPLPQLIDEYVASWSRLVSVVTYRDRYEQYFIGPSLVHDIHYLVVEDAQRLADFRASRDLYFNVALSDLPASRFEAKVEAVYLALVGATASAPAITVIVEHSGDYQVRKRDSTTAELVLRPRSSVVLAAESNLQYGGGASGTSPSGFSAWGRGIAAVWHLYIEDAERLRDQVDLTNLTKIQIGIGYQAFLQ
jgi:hypothetical protein